MVSVAAPCGATSSSSTSSATPTRRAATVGVASAPKARWPQMGAIVPHVAASVGVPHVGAAPQGGSPSRGQQEEGATLDAKREAVRDLAHAIIDRLTELQCDKILGLARARK